jgi:hypothetical protein
MFFLFLFLFWWCDVCVELVWSLWVLECLGILDEVVGAAMKHVGGEVAHDGARLHVQLL